MSTSTNNTNMKACFSLSSLHPDHSPGQNTSPGHAQRVDTQRLYHSLTKRPKRPWNENAGLESPVGSKDEFWAALQPNYNYLMGRQLIDSCCQELLANSSQHSPMNVSAESSCNEITSQPAIASSPISDVETELGGIKQWLNEAEEKLGPGVTECRSILGKETLPQGTPFALRKDAKLFEHKTLQQDIEARGKTLSGLLRLCQSSSPGASGDCEQLPPHQRARALKLAQRLEKRWQFLYLKNLEWILQLETSGAVSTEPKQKPRRAQSASARGRAESRFPPLLSAAKMLFAFYGIQMDLWNTLFAVLGSTLVIVAAKLASVETPSSEAASDSSEDEPGVTPARKKRLVEVMSPDVCTKGEQLLNLESQMRFTQSGKSSVTNSAVYYYKHSTTEYSSEDEDDDTGWTFRPQLAAPVANKSNGRRSSSSSSVSSTQPLSDRSAPTSTASSSSSSSSSEDLNASVATCIGNVVMRPKRSPQRVKRRPVSLPFSLMSPEAAATTPTAVAGKTCSETNLAVLSRRKRTMRRSKRRLLMASQSSESEDRSAVVRSSSFSGTIFKPPSPRPDGCHSDPSSCHRLRRTSVRLTAVPPVPVAEESGEPSWDNYQERYNSEAYSEDPLDAEAARRLLEFGDDYSRYLRDCSSPIRRETVGQDSDSEVEELRYVLKLSQESLAFTSQRLQLASTRFDSVVVEALGPDSIVSIGELAEMAATCRESRKCVELVITRIEQEAAGVADMQLIYELLDQWEDLESKTQELQRASNLARDVAALRQSLFGVTDTLGPDDQHDSLRQSRLESRVSLQGKLEVIREQMHSLSGVKGQLCEMSSLIQRLATEDNGAITQQIKSVLRGQIGELFDLWELNNQRLSAELNRTQQHLAAWQELDRQLSMLRGCLLRDRENLLTRHKDDSGSLSDSGISDAGSDVLETRGQELMSLRALADQLPAHTRNDIVQELDAAEKELEQLRLYSSQKNLSVSAMSVPAATAAAATGKEKQWPPRHWLKLVPLCVVTLVAVVCSFLQPPNCCEYIDSSGKIWIPTKISNQSDEVKTEHQTRLTKKRQQQHQGIKT
ncbi:Hypothetical predicted protein [Cloeon dipterum]|uniref:KASH domain-containing protein n=1 Tax=Cloeon dipterum TaxID=197152 RepID=A0A8S1C2M5_9INSE|nr:Hypothetical predicted protein [Cloeon dipterum]